MTLSLALLSLLGCTRDPVVFGYWDITRVTVGGTRTANDAGTLEFGDGEAWLVARYGVEGDLESDTLPPDPTPTVTTYETNAHKNSGDAEELFSSYQEDGETYFVTFGSGAVLFSRFQILDYTGNTMTLSGASALGGPWGDPSAPPVDGFGVSDTAGADLPWPGWAVTIDLYR